MPCSGSCQNCKNAKPYIGCDLLSESEIVNETKKMISAMEKRIEAYYTHPSLANTIGQKLREQRESEL